MKRHLLILTVLLFTVLLRGNAAAQTTPNLDPSLEAFVQSFKGKGALNDGSRPLTPKETIEHFQVAPGLKMEVVAHEPIISQPLNLHFDERGRMWVVQYLQYPFPAGLKIVKYDEHLRAVFDQVPPPPPDHFKGKDRVTILEDKDGDGVFESQRDFLSDLNIVRSVVTGRGGVWVLNPPYLLFYADKNRDDLPDGDPRVVLSGFGIEDTHSGANSLAWGPDGWLYGAHGSTCTADIRGVKFLGQAIWRYHPATDAFEVFAEGGGNTFSFEFDAKGRAFSGTNNGATRGMHYPQGSAGIKNWGKHGPLMNPNSFGWFEHMAHTGYAPRFTQTMCIYEGGAIPQLEGCLISPMSLMNRVMAARMSRDTSTYRTDDLDPLVTTDDRWFRPVDTKVGPDGAIYLADWYDSRLTHVDPRDTWDKERGRIYRLAAAGAKPAPPFDLAKLPTDELIETLRHPNKFFRQTAMRIFHDRHDASLAPKLRRLVAENTGQFALECFWALNASGGFTDEVAFETLGHQDECVRSWTVRLLGDRSPPARYSSSTVAPMDPLSVPEGHRKLAGGGARNERNPRSEEKTERTPAGVPESSAAPAGADGVSAEFRGFAPPANFQSPSGTPNAHAPRPLPAALQKKLEALAREEADAQVRVQLASSAKRLPGAAALPILREMMHRAEDGADKHLPLLVWWALESKATSDRAGVLDLLKDSTLWRAPLFSQFIVARLGQRYTAERTGENFATAAQLLAMAPAPECVDALVHGMEAGLRGDRVAAVPAALGRQVAAVWDARPRTPTLVSFALRLGHPSAAPAALELLTAPQTTAAERQALLELLAERRVEAAVPILTTLLRAERADAARLALLSALSRFNTPEAGQTILDLLPAFSPAVRPAAVTALSSRVDWARALLALVDREQVKKEQVSVGNLLAMKNLADSQIDLLLKKHWGTLRASSKEKEDLIKNLRMIVAREGDAEKGRELYKVLCAACHTLKGEGGKIGPDLTGYERDNLDFMLPAIVDPSLGIREEFTLYNLTTKDGQVLAGFVAEDTPQFVTMLDAAGNRTRVAREDIQSRAAFPTSLMPEGLLNALTTEQTRDLFTYLKSK